MLMRAAQTDTSVHDVVVLPITIERMIGGLRQAVNVGSHHAGNLMGRARGITLSRWL